MRTVCCSLLAAAMLLGVLSWAFAVDPVVKAPGTITASGNGLAHVRIFHGSATFSGKGRLRVSSAAQVQITSGTSAQPVTQTSKNGKTSFTIYKNFNGTATITGQDVHVYLQGKSISVSAQGAGRAHFIGTGTFTDQTQDKAVENGDWAAKPAQKLTAKDYTTFWNAIRRVYGDYDFKNGKEDEDGSADLN